MTAPSSPAQLTLRLLLSASAAVMAAMMFMAVVIGYDYDRMHGDKSSYILMAAVVGVLALAQWAIWRAKAGMWQKLALAVALPLALAILWMVGVLPCSTRLNCPF